MTRLLDSAHTEKLGVAEIEKICAKARNAFRRITVDDVGIDGFIEVFEDGTATGIICGVQIKSGDSFVSDDGIKFTFQSDQDHFGYWARCSFPVIGIVFSPKYKKSVWFDITGLSTDERIINGPYSITLEYGRKTLFNHSTLISQIIPTILNYSYQRRTLFEIKELIGSRSQKAKLLVPNLQVSGDQEKAWYELIQIMFALNSTDEDIADAGHRLSWYFPAVSKELQSALINQLSLVDDFLLVRILRVIHKLIENDSEPVSELIIDLLDYIPNIATRIENLLVENKIATAYKEGAIQAIEFITQKERSDLRI